MSVPHSQTNSVRHPLRLRLKPKTGVGGYVDGGWWPRSRDLAAELPALADVLAVRLGSVQRVVFPLTSWDTPPRRVDVRGHSVRLEGFHSQDEHVINIVAPDRRRIRLLVVPPDAVDTAAHDALMTAAGPENIDTATVILMAAGILRGTLIPVPRLTAEDADDRREVDGGQAGPRG
jgi:hypothetical protein